MLAGLAIIPSLLPIANVSEALKSFTFLPLSERKEYTPVLLPLTTRAGKTFDSYYVQSPYRRN